MAVLYVRVDDELDAEVTARAGGRGMSKNAWVEEAIVRALEGQSMGDAAEVAGSNKAAAAAVERAAEAVERAGKAVSLIRRDLGRTSQAAFASLMLQCWAAGPALDLLGAEDGPAAALADLPMEDLYRMFWRCAGVLRRDPAPGNLMGAYARLAEYLPEADIEELTGFSEEEWREETRSRKGYAAE